MPPLPPDSGALPNPLSFRDTLAFYLQRGFITAAQARQVWDEYLRAERNQSPNLVAASSLWQTLLDRVQRGQIKIAQALQTWTDSLATGRPGDTLSPLSAPDAVASIRHDPLARTEEHKCQIEYRWYHKGTTVKGYHPRSGLPRLVSSPIPLIVEAEDRHALQYSCSCMGTTTRKTVPVLSEVIYKWQAKGGGSFGDAANDYSRPKSYEGPAVLFSPDDIPPNEQRRYTVVCEVLHGDADKRDGADAGSCTAEPPQPVSYATGRLIPQPHAPARVTFSITVDAREGTLQEYLKGLHADDEILGGADVWPEPSELDVNDVGMWEPDEVSSLGLSTTVHLETNIKYYEVRIELKEDPVEPQPMPKDSDDGFCVPSHEWKPGPPAPPITILQRATVGTHQQTLGAGVRDQPSAVRRGLAEAEIVDGLLSGQRAYADDYIVLSVQCESAKDRLQMSCSSVLMCLPASEQLCMRDVLEYEWEVDPSSSDEGYFVTPELLGGSQAGRPRSAKGEAVIWRNLNVRKPSPDTGPDSVRPPDMPPITFRVTVRAVGRQLSKPPLTAREDARLELTLPYKDGLRRVQFGEVIYIDKDAPGFQPPRTDEKMRSTEDGVLYYGPDYTELLDRDEHAFRWESGKGWRHLASKRGAEDFRESYAFLAGQHRYTSHHPWALPIWQLSQTADPVPPDRFESMASLLRTTGSGRFRQLVGFDVVVFERRDQYVALWSRIVDHVVDPGWTQVPDYIVVAANVAHTSVGLKNPRLRRWFVEEMTPGPWRGYLKDATLRVEHGDRNAQVTIRYKGRLRLGEFGHRMMGFLTNRTQAWIPEFLKATVNLREPFTEASVVRDTEELKNSGSEDGAPVETYARYWRQVWPRLAGDALRRMTPLEYSRPGAAVSFLEKGEKYDSDKV